MMMRLIAFSVDSLFRDIARQIHRVVEQPQSFDVALALSRSREGIEPPTRGFSVRCSAN
jgi:hypothetical protein